MMSKRKRDVLPTLIGCILAMTAGVSQAAEKVAVLSFVEAAQRTPGSAPVTAIGMRATRASDQLTLPTKIVLLVDTSASQIGEYRQAALDCLAGIFEDAREADRFLLAAVDVGCTPLAKDFLPSKGKDMQTALLALDARTPLGSTDIIAALDAAAVLFGQSTQPCAIIYIGDGPGLTAVDAADFQRVVDTLRSKHITFSGVGIGAQINWPCLAAIASATGGMPRTRAAAWALWRLRRSVGPMRWCFPAMLPTPAYACCRDASLHCAAIAIQSCLWRVDSPLRNWKWCWNAVAHGRPPLCSRFPPPRPGQTMRLF
jgi:hypothetical protein